MGIIQTLSSFVSQISSKLHFGTDASVATMILIIIIGLTLIGIVFRFLKKKIGKLLTLILTIVILFGTGVLSLSQFKNFAEGAGLIYQNGLPESVENDGHWLLEFFENTQPKHDEEVGSWVPDKNEASAEDWINE